MISRGMTLLKVGLAASALILVGNAAQAGPISFTDVVNPSDVLLNSNNRNFSFTHNIIDNGFDSTTDTLLSASITVNFRDDSGSDSEEEIRFRFDGDNAGTYEVDTTPGVTFVIDVSYLQTDGTLTVSLRQISGDVYFEDSTLTVSADRRTSVPGGGGATHLPEPTTLLLLGIGAGAAGLTLRRKGRGKGPTAAA